MRRFQRHGTIFVPELDDDAVRILGDTRIIDCDIRSCDTSQLALFTYLMAGEGVALHPAYQWQYPRGKRLIQSDPEFLKGNDVRLILDGAAQANEYAFRRIEKLKATVSKTGRVYPELQQYQRFTESQIKEDCEILDRCVVADGRIVQGVWNRDTRFRTLVRDELRLVRTTRYGQHLGALLCNGGACLSSRELQGIIDRLIAFSEDTTRLFSCDSVIDELIAMNYPEDGIHQINDRLHILHWKAHGGEEIQVPLVDRLDGGLIHPMDPKFFWTVSSVILGPEMVRELLQLPWPTQFRFARACRDDDSSGWGDYLSRYYASVEQLSAESHTLDENKVRKRLSRLYPGTERAILRDIPKWELALLSGWCAAVGCAWFNVPLVAITCATTVILGGAISPGPPIRKIWTAFVKSIRESASCDRNELREALRKRLNDLRIQPGRRK